MVGKVKKKMTTKILLIMIKREMVSFPYKYTMIVMFGILFCNFESPVVAWG